MADSVRSAIVAALGGVADIGRVHAYERYAKTTEALIEHYVDAGTGRLNGWFVRRVGKRTFRDGMDRIEEKRWQIRGYLALDDADATELLLSDQVDAIDQAFAADPTLGGVVNELTDGRQIGIAQEDAGPVMFGHVLCNSVRLSLITRKRHFCAIGG